MSKQEMASTFKIINSVSVGLFLTPFKMPSKLMT